MNNRSWKDWKEGKDKWARLELKKRQEKREIIEIILLNLFSWNTLLYCLIYWSYKYQWVLCITIIF